MTSPHLEIVRGSSEDFKDQEDGAFPPPTWLFKAKPAEPVKALVEGIMMENSISLFVGADEAYKSTMALAVGAAVAGGLPAFGAFPTRRPRVVLLVSEEDELAVIQNRIEALITGMGWAPGREFILSNIYVHALDGLLLDDPASQLHLLHLQESLGVELMIFDPLADLTKGEESSATDARPTKRLWRQLVARGCAVLVVHHLGKPREGSTARDRVRGSSAWISASRTAYLLAAADEGIDVECIKMSRMRRPEPFRVNVAVETDPENPAAWREARLTVAGRSGDWQAQHRRTLTRSERKALTALDEFREEALSWTRWMKVSGLAESTLADVRRRLIDLGYIDALPGEKNRFGKVTLRYSCNGAGTGALISSPDSETTGETTARLRAESQSPDSETTAPPLGGRVFSESIEGTSEAPDSGSIGDAWEAPE